MRRNWKKIGIGIAIAVVLAGCFALYQAFDQFKPSEDEIAIHIQFDTKEDVGLLVFDCCVDGQAKYSGGTSNADKSLIRHDSEDIIVWNRDDLDSLSDAVQLSVQFRIITQYVTPNFENIYPEDITRYANPINFEAHFGELYFVTITGDKTNGYEAVLKQ